MADHLHSPPHLPNDPLPPLSCVALIHPHFFQPRKQALDRLQQERHTFPILDIGLMDHHFEKQTCRINQNMSLPARQFLAAIVAVWSPTVSGPHRLAVDDASREGSLA